MGSCGNASQQVYNQLGSMLCHHTGSASSLPFTGYSLILMGIIAVALILAGVYAWHKTA